MSVSMRFTTAALGVLSRRADRGRSPAPPGDTSSGPPAQPDVDPARRPSPPPRSLRWWGSLSSAEVAGETTWHFVPRKHRPGREILYLPGGSYVNPMITVQWNAVLALARSTRSAVTVLQYPLAPEHTSVRTHAVLDAVYAELRARSEWFFLAGDSSGGNAALNLADRHKPTSPAVRDEANAPAGAPDGMVCLAPWTDLSLSNPAVHRVAPRDPVLRVDDLVSASTAWARPMPPQAPSLSPARRDPQGLPPLLVSQGGRDLFLPDTRDFVARARDAGVEVEYLEDPDGFHVHAVAVWTPEARRVYRRAGAFVDRIVARTSR